MLRAWCAVFEITIQGVTSAAYQSCPIPQAEISINHKHMTAN